VYRASIESEVGHPPSSTEKGNSKAKYEAGCELTSVVKEFCIQTRVLRGSVAL